MNDDQGIRSQQGFGSNQLNGILQAFEPFKQMKNKPQSRLTLPIDSTERKNYPLFRWSPPLFPGGTSRYR